jgi:rhodanese-related sulfurtransferase
MKRIIFFSFLYLLVMSSCTTNAQHTNLKPDAFQKGAIAAKSQILDVRTPEEYNNGHLKDAIRADWNNEAEFEEKVKTLDKTRSVYVYCQSGRRSSAAAKQLKKEGFTQVYNLAGGMNAWTDAGKPVE